MIVHAYDTNQTVVKNISNFTLLYDLESEKWDQDKQEGQFSGLIHVLKHSLEQNNPNAMCCCVYDATDKSLIAIGYVHFPQHLPGSCFLNELIVRHDFRNKFWGSLLVSKIKLHAIIDKKASLFLLTPLKSAINFWERMGFRPVTATTMGELFPKLKVSPAYHLSPECLKAMYEFRA